MLAGAFRRNVNPAVGTYSYSMMAFGWLLVRPYPQGSINDFPGVSDLVELVGLLRAKDGVDAVAKGDDLSFIVCSRFL